MNEKQFTATFNEEVYVIAPLLTVVLDAPWSQLPADQVQLLAKILGATGHPLESVRIVYQPNLDLSAWVEKPSFVIAFADLPKGVSPYEVLNLGDTTLIASEPLSILVGSETSKRKLWDVLKGQFQKQE